MPTFALIVAACWFCALLAMPHKPRTGNEVAELVYSRLLGRQQRVVLFALIVTAVAFLVVVLSLPERVDPILDAVRHPQQVCDDDPRVTVPTCYTRQPDGTWEEEVLQGGRTWQPVAIVLTPPAQKETDSPLH